MGNLAGHSDIQMFQKPLPSLACKLLILKNANQANCPFSNYMILERTHVRQSAALPTPARERPPKKVI